MAYKQRRIAKTKDTKSIEKKSHNTCVQNGKANRVQQLQIYKFGPISNCTKEF